eukprot:Colp12_sorted_trinity150504_noHs@22219
MALKHLVLVLLVLAAAGAQANSIERRQLIPTPSEIVDGIVKQFEKVIINVIKGINLSNITAAIADLKLPAAEIDVTTPELVANVEFHLNTSDFDVSMTAEDQTFQVILDGHDIPLDVTLNSPHMDFGVSLEADVMPMNILMPVDEAKMDVNLVSNIMPLNVTMASDGDMPMDITINSTDLPIYVSLEHFELGFLPYVFVIVLGLMQLASLGALVWQHFRIASLLDAVNTISNGGDVTFCTRLVPRHMPCSLPL